MPVIVHLFTLYLLHSKKSVSKVLHVFAVTGRAHCQRQVAFFFKLGSILVRN